MTNTVKITCRVTATAPGLTLIARVDDREIFRGDACSSNDIVADLADDDAEHVLVFELSGKTAEHTKIDQSGAILQDTTISVQGLAFDEIELGNLFYENAVYEHDSNGTGPLIQDQFYGIMGCNCTVSLQFPTPIYFWMIENM